ncbi:MAG TPA: hypothetical protein PLD10_22435, partial [Rhodopila sp.]|nr:hypothetical protein [Rhodopila sp.]
MIHADQQDHSQSAADTVLRHMIEAEWLALGRTAPIARAGLAAARIVAQAIAAENADLPDWLAPMAADLPPDEPSPLLRAWRIIGQGAPIDTDDILAIRALWPVLAPADAIMETGGDIRLQVDPQTRLNGYGASHRPRPWAITYASTTASSVSERGYAAAEAARRATTAAMLRSGDRHPIAAQLSDVRKRLGRLYDMAPGSAVVLAASGTDTELLALALAHLAAPEKPVLTILIAPEETGSGVPKAALGRHFAVDTASGQAVIRESPVAGFRTDTQLAAIPLRDAVGAIRPIESVEAEITDAIAAGLAAGRRVILHVLDLA